MVCWEGLTLEDGGVARLDGERGNVGNDLGAGLEDDEQDADGARDALEDEAVVELGAHLDVADGVVEVADIEDALEHVVPLALLAQVQARHERLAQGAVGGRLARQLEVARVGGEDVVAGGGQRAVDRLEGGVAVGGGQRGQRKRGRLGGARGGLGGGVGQGHAGGQTERSEEETRGRMCCR